MVRFFLILENIFTILRFGADSWGNQIQSAWISRRFQGVLCSALPGAKIASAMLFRSRNSMSEKAFYFSISFTCLFIGVKNLTVPIVVAKNSSLPKLIEP
jgi:hypothetical protein